MIDTSKLINKAGAYSFATSGAVTDKVLLEIASQYELTVSRKMQAVKPQELSKRFVSSDMILETTKYDGEGVFIYFDQNHDPFCFNAPSGRVRIGLPVLIDLHQHLKTLGIKKGLLRAELYLPNSPGSHRPGISELIRVSFSGNSREVQSIKLAFIDIIMLDGKDFRANLDQFSSTWELLERYFGTDLSRSFHRMEGCIVPEHELSLILNRKVEAGQEGIVIRRLNRFEIFKIKPHLTVDAAIIGYIEGEIESQLGVTSILTALTYPGYNSDQAFFQTFARIGSGLTDHQRSEMLNSFAAHKVVTPITMADSDGRTVNFVKPGFILEVEGDDLVSSTSQERENRTQLFSWSKDHFDFLGLTFCPRITFPIFGKMRPDKDICSGGARLEQIVRNPSIPTIKQTIPQETKILRREVYTKADIVRKLVVTQRAGEDVVPYAIYWTDFSAKRKDPLKVSVAFAYNERRASQLAEKFLFENLTKGFTLFTPPEKKSLSQGEKQ